MFSVVTNSDTINAKQCRINQTQNLACKWQLFSYSCVWSDRIRKRKVLVRDFFLKNKNVPFQIFSPENPAMKENLHHIYKDLFPLKCVLLTTFFCKLAISSLCLESSQHHSILEPLWKFLTNLKIILSLLPYCDRKKLAMAKTAWKNCRNNAVSWNGCVMCVWFILIFVNSERWQHQRHL